jgi:hypothetical protein
MAGRTSVVIVVLICEVMQNEKEKPTHYVA